MAVTQWQLLTLPLTSVFGTSLQKVKFSAVVICSLTNLGSTSPVLIQGSPGGNSCLTDGGPTQSLPTYTDSALFQSEDM